MVGHGLLNTEAILESISDGVFTVNAHYEITSFNRAAEQITKIPREEALGRPCSEVFRSSMCETDCALRHTLSSGTPVINKHCYIVDADGERIPTSVSTAVLYDDQGEVIGGAETFRDLREVEKLRQALQGQTQLGDLVSHSRAMQPVFELIRAIAESSSTALIRGETGTGKELVARAIHGISDRADKPFIALNCGALPETLLESELFGYKRGAFTGADRDKPGRLAEAAGGTLFLDEIGEISSAMQVRLLRVLQERVYEPVGSNESVPMTARILAATHRDLKAEIEAGRFRQDLFYRINVICIDLPPLCDRKEDIPYLVKHFITLFNKRQHKSVQRITPGALALLMAHDWPGNVRELENVIERAFVLCREAEILVQHLPPELSEQSQSDSTEGTILEARQSAEAQTILKTLAEHNQNRQQTANALGIHKTTRQEQAAYYTSISMVDAAVGKLLDHLEEIGQLDNTLIIFTSDHGEMLKDHGLYQKMVPYESSVRIPFVMRYPKQVEANSKESRFVDLMDIMPTALDAAGIDLSAIRSARPFDPAGSSLLRLDQEDVRNRTTQRVAHNCLEGRWVMVRDERYKYVHFANGGIEWFFDLKEDPCEMNNLVGQEMLPQAAYDRLKKLAIEQELRWGPKGSVIDGKLFENELPEAGTAVLCGKFPGWANMQMPELGDGNEDEEAKLLASQIKQALSWASVDYANTMTSESLWIEHFIDCYRKRGVSTKTLQEITNLLGIAFG